jgi:hypothetical protein
MGGTLWPENVLLYATTPITGPLLPGSTDGGVLEGAPTPPPPLFRSKDQMHNYLWNIVVHCGGMQTSDSERNSHVLLLLPLNITKKLKSYRTITRRIFTPQIRFIVHTILD